MRSLQIMCPGYKFEIAPIVVGTMECFPKYLVTSLKMVGFKGKEIKLLICRMQMKSIFGNVKICKMFGSSMILKSECGGVLKTLSNIFGGIFSRK